MKLFLTTASLLLAALAAHGQVYNDGTMANPGGLTSDWSTQYISTATGTYSTAGSTGPASSYGVFEHRGQSGTGTSAAMVNNGIYNASVFGRDYFMGPNGTAGQQEISGSVMPDFGELYIENGATSQFDITNTAGARVATSTAFANGITTTVRNNTIAGSLKFADNAIYSGGNTDAQHVNGYVTKTGDDGFTFPVGDGTQLRTLTMAAPAAATDSVSVAWFTGNPSSIIDPSDGTTHSTTSTGAPIQWVSPVGFWDWIPASGSFTNSITVSIPDLSSANVNAADLRLVGWNGVQWIPLGTTGATGNTAGSVLSGTMQNGITAIGIGSISNPLPVLFSNFAVIKDDCKILLNWSTAMEQNNDHFEVEHSTNGRSFSVISKVQAAGNSSETQHYSFIDEHPVRGMNYCRIAQVDVDGKRSTTAVKSVNFDDCGSNDIQVYPTITKGTLFVELPVSYENVKFSVYTTSGQQIKIPISGEVVHHASFHSIHLDGLAQGQYLLRVSSGEDVYIYKILYQP